MVKELFFLPIPPGVKVIDAAPTEKQRRKYFALGHHMGFSSEDLETEAEKIYHLQTFEEITGPQIDELYNKLAKKYLSKVDQEKKYNGTHIHKWVCECGDRLFVQLTLLKGV